MFRVGDRYRIGPSFTNGDIANMVAGMTRETILIVSTTTPDRRHATFVRESDGRNFWPLAPLNNWAYDRNWFVPVPEEFLLVEIGHDGSVAYWVNVAGSQRMTLDQARTVVQQDCNASQELHLIPLRSVFKFSVDEDGEITETDYRNAQQGA